ncbi:MAG TPA: hypothetical protein VHZ30_02745 [Verrucomicrobiae bacterium]|jgi:hypothetical protein|nr:hypothetical protein [Verrucomicrobiae bacterium]
MSQTVELLWGVKYQSEDDPVLLRVMVLGTTSACAVMAGTLEALRAREDGFYFDISWRTGVVVICSAAMVMWAWRIVLDETETPRHRLARRVVKGILLAVAAAAFLYPLRFVPKSKLPEIAIGLGMATCALSIVGFLLFRARRFLEEDEKKTEEK